MVLIILKSAMLLKNIEPFVRQALIAELEIDNKIDVFTELQSCDCRMFYILSDKGAIVIEGEEYPLTYGSVILFQGGTKYTWQADESSAIKFIAINFDYTQSFSHVSKSIHPVHSNVFKEEDVFEKIIFEDAKMLNKPIILSRISSFEYRIKLLASEFAMKNKYCEELTSSLLKTLIVSVVRNYNISATNKKQNYKFTREVIDYIQNNYSEDLTNEEIAKRFHLNPVYLNRIFKKNTNMSIHAFLISCRMNVAMLLLRSEDTPIKKIAQMVGYDDPVQFSKIFKNHIGQTPKEFRKH